MNNLATPPPTWCARCGDRFRRAHEAGSHICRPNYTPFNPNDPVTVDGEPGVVSRVDRWQVEVYFRRAFRAVWFPADRLERVA